MSVNIGKGTEQALKQTLRQRVAALSEQQRAILAQKLQALQDSDVSAQVEGNTKQSEKQSERKGEKQSERPTGNPQRLVAYIVSNCSQPDHQSSYQSSHQSIRATLKKKLPAYMVPSAIVSLPSLPRLANGKIDVRALPEPDMALSSASADATTEPRNPVEKRLCQIWQTVLGVQSVGIHDNFFELGGDSILSIQIVSQARESGLRLAPNQLFDQPTVAELAAAVNLTPEVAVSQETITGPVPLTPIQHWFFSQDMVAPQHWHQAMLLALPSTASSAVGMQLVKDAIATLWQHHDALRLRFIPTEVKDATDCQTTSRTGSSVRWQQMNAAADMAPIVEKVNLSGLDAEQQQRAIATHGEHLHASVNLQKGNLFRAVHFTQGIDQPSWLLISSHHLAVDAVSWQILEEDVRSLLSPLAQSSVQSASDRVRQLPKKTTSFKAWAELLAAQAQSHRSELPFWLAQLEQSQSHLPRDFSSEKSEAVLTEGTAKTITVALDPDSTSALLKTVPAAYSTQINDILLTGLAQTLLEWIEHSSGKALESICIDVEAHGREQFIEDIDISRTVGWFTTTYPICLQLQAPEQSGIAIKSVKEQLRQIPKRGIGYGLLRYLSDEPTRNRLANAHSSEVLFNYLGQRKASELNVDQQHENNAIRLIEDVDVGALRDSRNCRDYPLEINAWVSKGQLSLTWTYDAQRYQPDTIKHVASSYISALKRLIEHCLMVEQGGFTPSDFPAADFTQSELDSFLQRLYQSQAQSLQQSPKANAVSNIETIYPLAPLQQAFLWHDLQTSKFRTSAQSGLLHMRGTLHGELDEAAFKKAWMWVTSQHAALRTSVHWEGIKQPVQVVAKRVQIPWQSLDWREKEHLGKAHSESVLEDAIADFLESDRTQRFDLIQPPISRITLIRLNDRTYEFIWTCHHLMLDGWSGTLVVNQSLDAYAAIKRGATPDSSTHKTSYESYVHWLGQQDEKAAKHVWQQALAGFTTPTPLPLPVDPSPIPSSSQSTEKEEQKVSFEENATALSEASTANLQAFLTAHRLTLNTLLQGLWALLLAGRSGQSDVLFGTTVSGRQAELAGIESVVGLLINVLPVRVNLPAEHAVVDWLQSLQAEQSKLSPYAYASPTQIQSWSECSERLFDSLLVIENYPAQKTEKDRTLHIENLRSGIVSAYGLTLIVKPGNRLTFYVNAPGANPSDLDTLLADLKSLLLDILSSPTKSIQEISYPLASLPNPQQRVANTISASQYSEESFPKNSLELALTQIWKSALNAPTLTTQDNFFSLGGDSLRAVQLFNKMQQQLNCTLPLATLFQAPTVQQFAALLSTEQNTEQSKTQTIKWSSLVPIQPNGSRRPFFFHGGSADAITWARFSQLLGSDQPFYALQRPDLDGSTITDATVESLAAACIEEIKTVQQVGPYVIGGHCFGGAVAFEIARQLRAQGEEIAALIQIDAYCPNAVSSSLFDQLKEQLQLNAFSLQKAYYYHGNPQKIKQLPEKVWKKVRRRFRKQHHRTSSTARNLVSEQLSEQSHLSPYSPSRPPAQEGLAHTESLPYEQRYAQVHQSNIEAAEQYQPKPYSGPIQIFCATTQILTWHYGEAMGWQTVTPDDVQITPIPGLFGNLFNKKSAPLLAKQVQTYLDTRQ